MVTDSRDLEPALASRRGRVRRARRRTSRVRVAGVVAALALAAVAAAVVTGIVAAPSVLASQCSLRSLKPLGLGVNSVVVAADGSLLGVIPATRNRQQLPLADISPWVQKATVAVEDRRFWRHGALDYIAIVRAAIDDIANGRPLQGGSTLTQQLARNLYIGRPKDTLGRKLQEACLALRLARRLSKRQILADYLNVVPYGNHAYGVAAAAETYFSRPASQLTVWQAALLAGLPQAPSAYDPLRYPGPARERRNVVLRALLQAGDLSPAAFRWAVRRPLGLRPGSVYQTVHEPYFFSYVDRQLLARYGRAPVESGGLRVRTTIDPRLQDLAQQAMTSILRHPDDPAAAVVAIDPRDGDVRAMAVDVPSGERLQFNLATQGQRQAGSAFKPFTLATVLEHGIPLSATYNGPPELTVADPRCDNGGQPWVVHNNADETAGTMDLIDATANSVNTIFAQLVSQVGPDAVVRMAHRLGIESSLEPVCSITLGTQAVSPLEMTVAYATLADHGIRHAPRAIESIATASGQPLHFGAGAGREAVAPQIADEVTYALEAVTQKGTGTAAAIGRPIAGKTGTAEKFVDAWFCGYVPQLATCVWVGYPHREVPMNDVEGYAPVYGGTIPALVWHAFMAGALAGIPVLPFTQPAGIVPPQVTTTTGG
jgi:penicillin-binding protein 1A